MALLAGLLSELGYHHVTSSHSLSDMLLFASRFVRLFAFGAVAPILILHLRLLGFPDKAVGLFLSLTLLGDVILSLGVTWVADVVGRRRVLALGALLMGVSGLVFATSESYPVLLGAAIIGIVSPSGNEVGPFSALEVGVLSQLVEPDARVYVLMWYQVLGFVGTAFGSFAAGVIISSLEQGGRPLVDCYRAVFLVYSFVAVLKVVLSLWMSIYTELEHPPILVKAISTPTQVDPERQPLLDSANTPSLDEQVSIVDDTAVEAPSHPPASQPLPLLRLAYLCILFSMDSFASSLIPTSFIAYYFQLRFNASVRIITSTFATAAFIGGLSQLLAGSIAKRAGIIKTMVGTHMPAQILTAALAIAPNLSAGIAIFLARSTIGSMDASVRGAFMSAIVPKASRTRFLGIVNVCKSLASAPGPSLSGVLASWGGLRWSFVICAGVKLTYDTGLLIGFKTARLEH